MEKKPNTPSLPRFIGLCGHPKSGKSLVQEFLTTNFGVQAIDDGGPLRKIVMNYFGLTWEHVHTQEGKASYVEILGKRWQVREILGELGNHLEVMFGPNIMPFMICASLKGLGPYSFGSVRKNQGEYYKLAGGILIGVRNPLAEPSPYAFDRFEESLVDHWIDNDALFRGMKVEDAKLDLEKKVSALIEKISCVTPTTH